MMKQIPFSTNLLGYAALATMLFSLICTCLALGLPYWEIHDVTTGSQQTITYQGLWQYCTVYTPQTTSLVNMCGQAVNNGNNDAALRAVQAMVVVALALTVAACVLIILSVFVFKYSLALHFVAGGSGVASGLCSMIALAVYLTLVWKDSYDLYAAFACDILSWIVSWTASGFIISMATVKKADDP